MPYITEILNFSIRNSVKKFKKILSSRFDGFFLQLVIGLLVFLESGKLDFREILSPLVVEHA